MDLPDLEHRTLSAAFERVLAAKPDQPAQLDRTGRWTYAEAYERARRIAGGLHDACGVRSGDPVLLMCDNHFDMIHTWFGANFLRAVEVPVNTAYKGRFLSHVINDSGARVLVLDEPYCERVARVAADLTDLRTVVVRGGPGRALAGTGLRTVPFAELLEAAPATPVRLRPWDVAAYMYTSGTTGRSKGVRIPHAQLYTYASREDQRDPCGDDRVLVMMPLFHLSGQGGGVYGSLIAGATCFVEQTFSASRFWDWVREYGITWTGFIGGMAEMIARRPPTDADLDHPLRTVVMCPLVGDVPAFRRRFGVEVSTAYGMTECGVALVGLPEDLHGDSVGVPRAGFDLRIVDEHDMDVPEGEVGELIIRPELPWTVMDGYHGLPERTAHAWRNMWLHTGDAFRRDAAGRYYFRDRIKDALRRRGENVSSFEVEQVINGHPDVLESAAVAVPSELTEDEIKAVVVCRPGHTLDPAALIGFLVERMPYFMVPRFVEVVPELPKTPTQKVRKTELRAAGVTATTWDREAAGVVVDRHS